MKNPTDTQKTTALTDDDIAASPQVRLPKPPMLWLLIPLGLLALLVMLSRA